jgi:hypothetical protein
MQCTVYKAHRLQRCQCIFLNCLSWLFDTQHLQFYLSSQLDQPTSIPVASASRYQRRLLETLVLSPAMNHWLLLHHSALLALALDLRKNFFSVRVCAKWNSLSSDIENSVNVKSFKANFKRYTGSSPSQAADEPGRDVTD